MKRLACGRAALVPMTVLTSWRKCLSMNETLLFFRMVSSNIQIVWGLGVSGGALFVRYVSVKRCEVSSEQDGILRQRWEMGDGLWGSHSRVGCL